MAMVFCLVLIAILIALGVIQSTLHRGRVKRIPLRILVNGTRGKTTVTRLLQSGLREAGYKVLAKTTGSEACLILPDGSVKALDRARGVNVLRETVGFFKLACSLGVDAIVLECQAIRPDTQTLLCRMVSPTVSIITNARIDHIDLMGDTIESTASVLRLSVPKGQVFYTEDSFFREDSNAILVESGERNRSLALRVLSDLGVQEDVALRGMDRFIPDIGLVGPFRVDGKLFINAFAANDMQSALEVLSENPDVKTIVYNNRSDREFRLVYFAEVFSRCGCKSIIVIGEHVRKCARFLTGRVKGSRVLPFTGDDRSLVSICGEKVVCMGNIKGRGESFIRFCQREE